MDLALGSDETANTRVGRAQCIAPRFQRPHTRDLQVLMWRDRIPEPGIVTDVDDETGVGERVQHFRPVGIFVANCRSQRSTVRGPDQRLLGLAGRKIPVRQTQHRHPFAHLGRYREVFAERHQVALAIHLPIHAIDGEK